ncbi:MAG TPA: hypothetical protein VJ978_07240 [Nitriliruptoraceae bacterium]|nr:hypothetical protein [Nitriliruptoraceae bacterium]
MTIVRQLATTTRQLGVVAVALILAVLSATPAVADSGITQVDEFTFEDVHPCTGEPRTVDAVYTATIHEHPNLTLLRIVMHSVASDGTVERGVQVVTDHVRRDVVRVQFNTVNVDAGGNRFIGHLRLVIDETGFHEDRSYVCTGGPT